jgi:hypothetical protein
MDANDPETALKCLLFLLEQRRQLLARAGVIDLIDERKKREARRSRSLPQVTGPGGEDSVQRGPDSDE